MAGDRFVQCSAAEPVGVRIKVSNCDLELAYHRSAGDFHVARVREREVNVHARFFASQRRLPDDGESG